MELYRYIKEHSTPPQEALEWLERQTYIRTNHSRMLSGAVQGRFLTMITRMIAPRRILELGTFTGYSSICLASALPEGGHLDTLEINDELEDLIREGFERAGVADRITLRLGDCKQILRDMREGVRQQSLDRSRCEGRSDGLGQCRCEQGEACRFAYDMVYIDANKREYVEYYELIIGLVKPGGYILADNVLWDSKVCLDEPPTDRQTQGILRFNEIVAADPRVENVILPIRDGLNLIRLLPE